MGRTLLHGPLNSKVCFSRHLFEPRDIINILLTFLDPYCKLRILVYSARIYGAFLILIYFSFGYFGGCFNKTVIPLALVGYDMIIANTALCASLAGIIIIIIPGYSLL